MKRLFLTVMAVLSMTMTFAEEEKVAELNSMNAYDMSVNIRKLGTTLGLTLDQMESVADVHHAFCGDMLVAAHANADERQALVGQAVEKDLKYMNYILTADQFSKYSALLKATLANRGIEK